MKSNQDNRHAIIFQSLYLANLLLLPLISFLILLFFLIKNKSGRCLLTRYNRIHLIRSLQISVLAGIVLGIAPLFYLLFSEQLGVSFMIIIFYFVTLHSGFVLIGMFNLARAMAKRLPLF